MIQTHKPHHYHPKFSIEWGTLAVSTILGGLILGMSWQIGSNLTNRFLFQDPTLVEVRKPKKLVNGNYY